MKTLSRNESNDIYMSGGGLAMSYDIDAQYDIIEAIILTQRGELEFAPNQGIDYFGTVFQDPRYITMWASQVKSAIKSLDWVSGLEDFKYNYNQADRSLSWSLTVINSDKDKINLSSRRKKAEKTTMTVNLNWNDIVGKPDKIEEAIRVLMKMREAAGGKNYLTNKSTNGEVKKVVNDVIIAPLKSTE